MTEILAEPAIRVPLTALAVMGIVLASQVPVLFALIKVSAHIHARVGPMYPGRFHGIGWPLAEAIKWIQKEDIIPERADRKVFVLAPLVALIPAFMVFAVIPIAPGWVAADLELGLFYVVAVLGMGAIAVVMAAYSAQSKFTLIGGVRAVGQVIAYELPLLLAALSIAMLAGTLNMTGIVNAQDGLWFVLNPFGLIAFAIFLTALLAEVFWAPFDMPLAESELVTGPFTEYSGMRFIFFMIAEFAAMVALSAVAVVIFLGGWHGPILPPVVWFVLKTGALVVFFIWVRFTFPRLREDQLQKFSWKILIEIGFANVLAIALFRVLT